MSKKTRLLKDIQVKQKLPVKVAPKSLESLTFSDIEKATFKQLNNSWKDAKCAVADITLRVKRLEEELKELNNLQYQSLADTVKKEQEMHDYLKEIAKTYGIDLNDTSNGKWTFNPDTLVFTKTG